MEQEERKLVGEIRVEEKEWEKIKTSINNISEYKENIENVLESDISDVLKIVMGGAIVLNASDIHFEPTKKDTKMRVRVDGILQEVFSLDREIYRRILSRIKLISGMKLNVFDRPQDGRFSVFVEYPIEIRVSSLPSEYGETVVMRVLNPKNLIDVEQLGLRSDLYRIFEREIKKPNGMIIVTGPTGSGKTTTLYAILRKIRKPEIKIITIEDPIEYKLEGITQTQVDPKKGYDFANGLRAIVRQDPDVILVGEIRDLETAQIAIQAALTGHLVLSTLHTNDAAGTVARLVALGEKPVNIAPAINMAVAQRLVRKVCKKCVRFEKPKEEEIEKIKKAFEKIKRESPKIEKIPRAVGCKDCNFTGYRGRCGIFEIFLVDDEMEKFILTFPSIAALREKAIEKGMIPMYQDGLLKVVEGVTTIEEVERVATED
jgi:type II secretory ATPase GspE/PulE/Tfp pilus assembly ATPase PilB-like protein